GTSNIQIGLYGAEYTSPSGDNDSYPFTPDNLYFNKKGNIFGLTSRFSGGQAAGQNLWCYTGSSTVRIGLTDADHTDNINNGSQWSDLWRVNDSGMAIGTSSQYRNGGYGLSAWFFNGTSTIQVGLVDEDHTFADGTHYV